MFHKKTGVLIISVVLIANAILAAQTKEAASKGAPDKIPSGAKVVIAPIADDFDQYLKEAIAKKQVPLEIVAGRDGAQYEITGVSESQKSSTAKKVLLGKWQSREDASITMVNIKSGEVVWAYSVHQNASTHGKRSSAEACAKHLKEAIAR